MGFLRPFFFQRSKRDLVLAGMVMALAVAGFFVFRPSVTKAENGIIPISRASKLDKDHNILADIYPETHAKDSDWATLADGQYVRVTFDEALNDTKDNTVYARPRDPDKPATIEVYPLYVDRNGNAAEGPLAAVFPAIDHEGTYKALLAGLKTPTDKFDLKIVGGDVDIDYIVDPSWLTGWSYRKKITISNTNVGADLPYFPLLVKIAEVGGGNTNIGYNVSDTAHGYDIRFTDSDGTTLLPYERESFSDASNNLTANFWAKIPTVTTAASTTIYIYYGNAGQSASDWTATTGSGNCSAVTEAQCTWKEGSSQNYAGVWHLKEATGANDADSTGNANTGSPTNSPTQTAGQIDGSLNFNGSTQYIDLSNPSSLNLSSANKFTLSAWVYPTSAPNGVGVISEMFNPTNTSVQYEMGFDEDLGNTTGSKLSVGFFNGSWHIIKDSGNIPLNAWVFITGTWDGTNLILYKNGASINSSAAGGSLPADNFDKVVIGKRHDTAGMTNFFPGTIDDARISSINRSANWIKFEYCNMMSTASGTCGGTNELTFAAPESNNLYWVGPAGGSWNSSSNWSLSSGGGGGAGVPGSSNPVIFDSGDTNTCNIDTNVNASGINITSGYSGTITQTGSYTVTLGVSGYAQAGGTFVGGVGNITDAAAFIITAGSFTSTSGTLYVAGNFTDSGTFTNNSGTVSLNGTSQTIVGATTFNNFAIGAPDTVTFPSGATQTFNGTFTATGSAGNVITINASTPGSAATLSKSSGTINCDYLALTDSTAAGGATWNAGSNSSNLSGNSGWIFPTGWLSGWTYRKMITVSNTNVGSNLPYFPLLVKIAEVGGGNTNIGYNVSDTAHGYDIRFTDSGGATLLPYDRESWSDASNNLTANLWVRVPTVSHTNTTNIYIYYTNSGQSGSDWTATTGSGNCSAITEAQCTWKEGPSQNLAGAWHLKEATGANDADSTGNANTGSPTNSPTQTAGQIDGSLNFNGTTQYIDLSAPTSLNLSSANKFTLSAWVYPTSAPNGVGVITEMYDPTQTTVQYEIGFDEDQPPMISSRLSIGFYDGSNGGWHIIRDSGNIPLNAWVYITGTWDGMNLILYKNGASINSSVPGGALPSANFDKVVIGKRHDAAGTTNFFPGIIDEARISSINRSADWIKFEYCNMMSSAVGTCSGTNELTFGSQDTGGTDRYWIGGTGNWSDTSHWANVSGGGGGYGVPNSATNVHFDVSSGGGTATLDVAASAANFTMDTGNTTNVTLGNTLTASGNFTITAGTFDISSGNYAVSVGGNWSDSGTFTARSGTVTLSSTTAQTLSGSMVAANAFNNIVFAGSGTKAFSNNASTTNVTIQAGSGALTAPSGLWTVSGNWSNSATFSQTAGKVDFIASGSQSISGSNTWFGLSVTGTTTRTVSFQSGVTQTVAANGSLTFRGAVSHTLGLAPITAGNVWKLAVSTTGVTQSVTYTSPSYSDASGSSNYNQTIDASGTGNSDGGNNTNWSFAIYSVTITSSGVISYGHVSLSTSSTTLGTAYTQVAKDDGAGSERLNVKSSDATGGTGWTLASTIGANQYTHEFSTTTGSTWTLMPDSSTYVTAAPVVAPNATANFDFRVTVPSTSDYQQKSITITIQAAAP